jgi:hypothetical protein
MGAVDLLEHVRAAGFTLDLADGKLLLTPASMLSDELRTALRASKTEVLALLAAEREADAEAFEERAAIMEFDGGLPRADAEAAARQCVDCEFLGRRRTCLEPVAAGLLTETQGYGIACPPPGHARACVAFQAKAAATLDSRAASARTAAGDPGTATARRLVAEIEAATLARGDSEANRRELLAEALALPDAQQLDLAEHFEEVARIWAAAGRTVKT